MDGSNVEAMAADSPTSTAETVLSAVYTAFMLADAVIVIDIVVNGALHRWAGRQARRIWQTVSEPFEEEAEIRRAAAWLVWEAMQVLEEQEAPHGRS